MSGGHPISVKSVDDREPGRSKGRFLSRVSRSDRSLELS